MIHLLSNYILNILLANVDLTARYDGAFSSSLNSSNFHCINCGGAIEQDRRRSSDYYRTADLDTEANSIIRNNSFEEESIEDSHYESEPMIIVLEIRDDMTEWNDDTKKTKRYNMEFLRNSKLITVNIPLKEINKSVLDSIYKLSSDLQAEELVVCVPLHTDEPSSNIRDLLVYGFERVNDQRENNNPETATFKIDVNQEYDFVDLI